MVAPHRYRLAEQYSLFRRIKYCEVPLPCTYAVYRVSPVVVHCWRSLSRNVCGGEPSSSSNARPTPSNKKKHPPPRKYISPAVSKTMSSLARILLIVSGTVAAGPERKFLTNHEILNRARCTPETSYDANVHSPFARQSSRSDLLFWCSLLRPALKTTPRMCDDCFRRIPNQ